MKRIISRTICLILALMMSVAVVGCGGTSDGAGNVNTGSSNNQTTDNNADSTAKDYTVGAGENSGKTATEEPLTEVIDTRDYESSIDALSNITNFGTHIYTSPTIADKWVVQNGVTEYKLVVATGTKEADKGPFNNAKMELVKWFAEATGILLEVVTDTSLPSQTHDATQKYISLGKTSLLASLTGTENEFNYDKDTLGRIGGRIKTVDNNIYLVGWSDQGAFNAVYTFLTLYFNYETYSANTTVIDRGVKNLNLRAFDVTDVPDIQEQASSDYQRQTFTSGSDYGYVYERPTEGGYWYGTRSRIDSRGALGMHEVFGEAWGDEQAMYEEVYKYASTPALKSTVERVSGGHNSVRIFKSADWKAKYPEWFATSAPQICYTAGCTDLDAEPFQRMTDFVAKSCILNMMTYPTEQYPYMYSCELTTSDDMAMCKCEACSELRPYYRDSGLGVRFFNEVAKKVAKWFETPESEPYKRDDFQIRYFAYYAMETSPTKVDPESGEWVPVDETVIMEDYTCIKYAPIAADFQQSLFAADNKAFLDNFNGWSACANGNPNAIGYFFYNYNCSNHNYFYDAFDWYNTEVMNYHFARGRSYYYSETLHGTTPTEWGQLLSYIETKYCYNSLLDTGKLLKNFFRAVYGPAAGVMEDMLMQMKSFNHHETVHHDMYRRRSNRNPIWHTFCWNPNIMLNWVATADSAIELIEPLKVTNPEEYDRIRYNIELEVFSPVYILYDLSLPITAEQHESFMTRFQENMVKYPEYRFVSAVGHGWLQTWINNVNV